MTAAHYSWPPCTAASTVSQHLRAARHALRQAGRIAERLVATDPDYRGTAGWDLQTAIRDTTNHISVAARIHDLSQHNPFRSNRAIHDDHTTTLTAILDLGPSLTEQLAQAFTDADRRLTAAAAAAARLAAGELDEAPYGTLGWDLEGAIDDARHALATATRHSRPSTAPAEVTR